MGMLKGGSVCVHPHLAINQVLTRHSFVRPQIRILKENRIQNVSMGASIGTNWKDVQLRLCCPNDYWPNLTMESYLDTQPFKCFGTTPRLAQSNEATIRSFYEGIVHAD